MKYSSTLRTINVAINAVLFAGFGALGIFFAFFAAPGYFTGATTWAQWFSDRSFNFSLNFAVIGLGMMLLSLNGLVNSIKALASGKDEDVTKTFLVYVGMGYAAAFWFFMNATLYYRAIGGNEAFGLWIVLFLLLMIGALIASNIPMVKMLEGKDHKIVLSIISTVICVLALSFFATIFPTLLVTLSKTGNYSRVLSELVTFSLISLVVAIVSGVSTFMLRKATKANKESKVGEILIPVSLGLIGAGYIVSSTFEHFFGIGRNIQYASLNCPIHGHGLSGSLAEYGGLDYEVMGFILGIVFVLAAALFIVFALLPEKKANKA